MKVQNFEGFLEVQGFPITRVRRFISKFEKDFFAAGTWGRTDDRCIRFCLSKYPIRSERDSRLVLLQLKHVVRTYSGKHLHADKD